MSVNVQKVIKEAKHLNAQDRAFIAHCLITSLEALQDEAVDQSWAELAEKRYTQLVSGDVKPVIWEDIKKQVIE